MRLRPLQIMFVLAAQLGAICGGWPRILPGAEAAPHRKVAPNVLIVMTDDQGFGDIQSHGNPWIQTPYQDRLAADGVRFDRFFVSPVCAPTRASLLTGRWHLRTGVHGVTRGYETMRSSEITIAEIFRDAGYATAAIGKWHNGAHDPEHPRGQGFDHFFGFCGGHFNNYFDSRLEDDDLEVPFEGFMIDRLTDRALRFMRDHRQQPWLCYVAFNTPHSPWQVPDSYWQAFAGRDDLPDDKARCAYAMVQNIDDNLGRMLDELERLKLDQQTIVVFLTDNGANSDRYNAGMRGRKGSLHEGGTRVPLFIRWPSVIPAGRQVDRIAAHIDLLPTLIDLASLRVPDEAKLDGRSLVPQLMHSDVPWAERSLYTHWGDDRRSGHPDPNRGAVRTDRWRAVLENGNWSLFDMKNDPGQTRNVASKFPAVVASLSGHYRDWFDDVTKAGFERIPIQIGRPGFDRVTLPGHEAVLHPAKGSGIRYSGRSGWANDWITGWSSPVAYPAWNLQVASPGVYEFTLSYKATQDQVGNVVRLQVGQQFLDVEVTTAHEPTRTDSPDRVKRTEVYEADWGKLNAGTLQLNAGPVQLALIAKKMSSSELLDVKAVTIRVKQN